MKKRLLLIAVILTVAALLVACGKKDDTSSAKRSALPRDEDTRTGFGTVSLAIFDKPDVDIHYAGEYCDANAPVRDESKTVTPKQAALSGCAMLCDMFGAKALRGAVGVRYCEERAARPYYEVYVQGASMDTAKYAATVDAELGVATYCGYQEALTLGETGAPLTLDERERQKIESDCLVYASDLIETLYAVGFVSGDSRTEAVEPFRYDRYDLACRVMLNTGGFEDYYFEYLYDRDDMESPILPLSCTRMEVREDGRIVAFAEKADENAFPIERVQHVYRVLCGEAQPLQAVETAPELQRVVQSAKEMLRLAKRDRNETPLAGKSASRQETMFDTEERTIHEMEEAIPHLPETRIPVDLDLIYAYRNTAVHVNLGEGTAARFSVANGMVSGIHFSDYGLPRRGRDYGEGALQITRAEAAARGTQLLADLGAEGYALARAKTVTVDRVFTAQYWNDEMKAKAWQLTYLLQDDPDFAAAKAPDFYPDGHKQPYVMLTMDDEKMIALDWKVPTSLAFSWD